MTAFLGLWARLPFADPEARLRVGRARGDRHAVAWDEGGRSAVLGARGAYGQGNERWYVEYRTGPGPIPIVGELIDAAELVIGWGTRERIDKFLGGLREHGPVSWDPKAVDLLAERTGISRATAALLLAALPNLDAWESTFLTTEQRTLLGLKTTEARTAREELKQLAESDRLELLDAALPEDPAELWREGMVAAAERLAAAWVRMFGRRATIPEDAYEEARHLGAQRDVTRLLTTLADPGSAGWLRSGGSLVGSDLDTDDVRELTRTTSTTDLLSELVTGLAWAGTSRPAGDPLSARLPELLVLARAWLNAPELLIDAGTAYGLPGGEEDEPREAGIRRIFGDRPYPGPAKPAFDDGVTVAVVDDYQTHLYIRPAMFARDEARVGVVRGLLADYVWQGPRLLTTLDLLRDDSFGAIAGRVRATPVPAGGFEADPSASVPELVTEVRDALQLTADAAALYLQLLTLLEPTDRNVRRWNGWTPARHKKAIAELTGAGLILAAKRSRAGRSVFLPGGWSDAASPNLPLETWKLPMYGLWVPDGGRKVTGPLHRFLPFRPLHDLFTHSWQRVQSGDRPT